MVFKWVLIVFGTATLALWVLGKVLAFLNPPRPNRPRPPLLSKVERTLRWTLWVPAAVAAALLALALWQG